MKTFTSKQKEVIARKLGYDGPMQGFETFLNSSPALQAKYNSVTDKYVQRMAKGGVVKKYNVGGAVTRDQLNAIYMEELGRPLSVGGEGEKYWLGGGTTLSSADQIRAAVRASTEAKSRQDAPAPAPAPRVKTTPTPATTFSDRGVPQQGGAATVVAAQIPTATADQLMSAQPAPTKAVRAAPSERARAAVVAAPAPIATPTMTAATAQPAISEALEGVQAATGQVSEEAQVQAVTQEPSTTALRDIEAAYLAQSRQVQAPADRTMQAGEMVSGSAVDQQRVDAALQQSQQEAAQGVVTEDMTLQGQLNRMMTDFDSGNPPAWAAASMRNATAQLSARGLGASSLAGQAIVQAAMEAAVPIASADAQVFQQMGLQNLSNRQQMAVLAAQQRAQFLGQEFDQQFQTRVVNASRVADIANLNFSAQQQIALENARMAQTVDLANLGNRQAVVMANAAQVATLETINLNNRQQASVLNAQAFLQMDLANMSNEQQITLFKSQTMTQALLSDTAAINASRQFNAMSQGQTDQFMTSITAQVGQFNSAQSNALAQFNVDQANAISRFNSEQQNAREVFNANQRLVIDQSNAQWRREISTANTAAVNATNYLNAQNIQQMTLAEYNNQTQLYRDQVQMAWQSYENDAQRITTLAAAEIAGKSVTDSANVKSKSDMWKAVGELASVIIKD